ncbi:hypothetical protein LBMAG53_06040 [Planctomycetota bacterium]|nr:hypothetical protein LBMAG53_06040 [Planctomycetota bacterium]
MTIWHRSARFHYRFATNRPVAPATGVVVDLSLNIVGDFVSHGGFRNYNPDITRPTPHLIHSGHGTMAFGGRTWDVGPGDVFVFFPGLPVEYADDPQRPWRYRWIGLEGPLALPALASIGLTPSQPLGRIGDPATVDRLLAEALSGTVERAFPPTRHIAMAWQLVAAIAAKPPAVDVDTVVHQLATGDPAAPPSITAISRRHRIAPSTVYRRATATLGIAPKAYQLERRFDLAQRLLAGRTLPVRDVAAQCGFNDANYFARAFRRRYGVAPSQWRSGQI